MRSWTTFLALAAAGGAPAFGGGGGGDAARSALIVVTNHGSLGDTGRATGYYLSEVAHPWRVFKDAGWSVEFASPRGGFAPMDPKSFDLEDPINERFWHTLEAVQGVANTRDLGEVDPRAYDALFFSGGHGAMWDFPEAESVRETIAGHYESGGVVAAVCHGPAALVGVELSNGKPLVAGKQVAAFTNAEERAVELTDAVPFLLESRLREAGAAFVPGAEFEANVVADQRLVTGQNPASAEKAAERVVALVSRESGDS